MNKNNWRIKLWTNTGFDLFHCHEIRPCAYVSKVSYNNSGKECCDCKEPIPNHVKIQLRLLGAIDI